MRWARYRGVPRLDGAPGKKELCRPMFKLKVFWKQMYCIEGST